MKICHVITRLIIGGAQENTVLTCRGLAERGHEVTLIAGPETGPEGSLWDDARAAGCALIEEPSLRRAVRPLGDWRALRALTAHFRAIQPDIVHTHSSKAGIIARAAAAKAGAEVIVHTIHGMSFNRTQSPITRGLYRLLERRAARVTHALVSVADAMTRQAVESGIAPLDRFTTVRSGMETDRYWPDTRVRRRVRRAWGVSENEVVVGTIARLFENKGYEEIIEAMPAALALAPNLKFVWIGDGAHRGRYHERLSALGLSEKVHFVGLIPPTEVPACAGGFDIVLHASRWEGLPRALVQGLLMGAAAVGVDIDGTPEVVIHEETGLLVPLNDPQALARALARLAGDAVLRCRLGRAGAERCRTMFDWRVMVDDLERLYARLSSVRVEPA